MPLFLYKYVKYDIRKFINMYDICNMVLPKEEFSILLGAKIRALRKRKGLTMQQLANEVGIEYIQLSRIERGKINTTIYQVYVIYNYLGEPITQIEL